LLEVKMRSAGAAEGRSCAFLCKKRQNQSDCPSRLFQGPFAEKKADPAVHTLLPKEQAQRCFPRDLNFFSICDSIIQKTDGDLHNCKSFLR